ncbi:MAG: condensation domain-containing protein, partial [Pseudonocardiaceae bacterium]
ESLRTVYPIIGDGGADDEPVQLIVSVEEAVPDLTPVAVSGEGELREQISAVVSGGFDVSAQVPLRVRLFEVGAVEHVLVVVVHHISADGFSMVPLARDVMAAYASRAQGRSPGWAPLVVQYADYTLWQRELLGSVDDPDSLIASQLGYWTRVLAGVPAVLALPADRVRPAQRAPSGGRVGFAVDAELHRALVALAREHDASVFMAAHAAFAVLMSRLSGSEDVVIGTPVAGRGEAALDDVVGMFVNTVVLRTSVRGTSSFSDLLDRVRESDLGAFAHAEVPFERVVEVLDPPRSTAYSPLFQVLLEFQDIGRPDLELPGLVVEGVDLGVAVSNFDLQLTVSEEYEVDGSPVGMTAGFTYATDLFDAVTVEGFAENLVRVLGAVMAEPDVPLARI